MTTRRDLIKWVLYLSATAALPKFATSEKTKFPTDILEGLSCVPKHLADLSGNAAAWRAAEDDAFEHVMRDMWRETNGSARYIRVFQDMAVQPPCRGRYEDGTEWSRPESYVSLFQYRRA